MSFYKSLAFGVSALAVVNAFAVGGEEDQLSRQSLSRALEKANPLSQENLSKTASNVKESLENKSIKPMKIEGFQVSEKEVVFNLDSGQNVIAQREMIVGLLNKLAPKAPTKFVEKEDITSILSKVTISEKTKIDRISKLFPGIEIKLVEKALAYATTKIMSNGLPKTFFRYSMFLDYVSKNGNFDISRVDGEFLSDFVKRLNVKEIRAKFFNSHVKYDFPPEIQNSILDRLDPNDLINLIKSGMLSPSDFLNIYYSAVEPQGRTPQNKDKNEIAELAIKHPGFEKNINDYKSQSINLLNDFKGELTDIKQKISVFSSVFDQLNTQNTNSVLKTGPAINDLNKIIQKSEDFISAVKPEKTVLNPNEISNFKDFLNASKTIADQNSEEKEYSYLGLSIKINPKELHSKLSQSYDSMALKFNQLSNEYLKICQPIDVISMHKQKVDKLVNHFNAIVIARPNETQKKEIISKKALNLILNGSDSNNSTTAGLNKQEAEDIYGKLDSQEARDRFVSSKTYVVGKDADLQLLPNIPVSVKLGAVNPNKNANEYTATPWDEDVIRKLFAGRLIHKLSIDREAFNETGLIRNNPVHDKDVIFIAELVQHYGYIRELEISKLHINSAASTINRLINSDIPLEKLSLDGMNLEDIISEFNFGLSTNLQSLSLSNSCLPFSTFPQMKIFFKELQKNKSITQLDVSLNPNLWESEVSKNKTYDLLCNLFNNNRCILITGLNYSIVEKIKEETDFGERV